MANLQTVDVSFLTIIHEIAQESNVAKNFEGKVFDLILIFTVVEEELYPSIRKEEGMLVSWCIALKEADGIKNYLIELGKKIKELVVFNVMLTQIGLNQLNLLTISKI